MTMRKAFHFFSALLLTGVVLLQGCGEDPEENQDPARVRTYTMTVVADRGETLSATWKAGEKVAVYNKTRGAGLEGCLEAQGDGASTTLKGTLTGVVAANETLTLKFLDSDYSEQEGTLAYIAAHCDYATADVTVMSTDDDVITTAAAASFTSHQAIVAFRLKESDGSAIAGGINHLSVDAGGTAISVTPGAATDVLYVAIPAFRDGTLRLSAEDANGTRRSYDGTGATFENGKFYEIDVRMDCIVMNDDDLFAANASSVPRMVLGADIRISGQRHVIVSGATAIDLNGHSISGCGEDGTPGDRIFYVDEGKTLTLTGPGTLKDGHADEGGAIYNRGLLILRDVSFTGCSAGLGGAVYSGGALEMSGAIVAIDNTGEGNAPDNIYLASGKVITVTGAFSEGSLVGVRLADGAGIITAGYAAHNGATDPATVFVADDAACHLSLNGGEAEMARGRYYKITAEKTYATLQLLLNETGRNLSGVESYLSKVFPDVNSPASAISYTYRSADPQGFPVELSAILYIPVAALAGTRDLTGICLTSHGTIASNAECPTMIAQLEGALAWKDYAVVMPDYYGFGASADRPQAYLDAETTGRGNIDAYLAAVQLLNDREVGIPDRLYSFGYSQGGFNSMANLMYVSKHPELHVHFEKVLCGGSPFDVELTWDAYTRMTFHNAIAFVPMTVVSINESQQLGLRYDDLFKGSLLANWREWILSKNYSIDAINTKLDTDDLSLVMNDEFMTRSGNAYDAIMNVCRRYSLTSGWVPPSGTKIILYHSIQDDTVPYENLTAMKAYLDQVAPGCYTAYDGHFGGHLKAITRFIVITMSMW